MNRQCGSVPRQGTSTLEFHGFHAFVHDRLSSPVRRMDRIDVGLHVSRRFDLHPLLFGHGRHRKSCGKLAISIEDFPSALIGSFLAQHTQVLNLFLALLLSSFGASNLSAPQVDNDTNKLTEAFNRISRFKRWVRRSVANGFRMIRSKLTNQISDQRAPGEWSI